VCAIDGDMAWGLGVSLGSGSAGVFGPGNVLLNEVFFMEVESALGLSFDGSVESFAFELARDGRRGCLDLMWSKSGWVWGILRESTIPIGDSCVESFSNCSIFVN